MEKKEVDEPLCVEVEIHGSLHEIDFNAISLGIESCTENKETSDVSTIQQEFRSNETNPFYDDQFAYIFYKIAGKDERIDAYELQRMMGMFFRSKLSKKTDFNLETCRCMLASIDTSRVGKLTYGQFQTLWKNLMKWTHTFDLSDHNKNGKIDYTELSASLDRLGVHLNDDNIRKLMNRFQNKQHVIEIDDFMQICCKITTAKHSFQNDIKDGTASLDAFFLKMIYL